MAVSAAPASIVTAVATRRGLVALIVLGMAAAVGVGIFYRSAYPPNSGSPAATALADKFHQGMNGLKTVADMLLGRSPGERAAGALANLKHKRIAAPHERALPRVRKTVPPSPLAAIVGAPATPIAPVTGAPAAGTPLYNVVNAPPPTVAEAPPPTVFPAMPPPPGGGFIVPPVITQVPPVTPPGSPPPPPPPPPPAVPEPGSWAMMLIGFATIARALRRVRPAGVIA